MKEIMELAPFLIDVLIRGALISFLSLGIVYIFGRMLGILRANTPKNALALIVMVGLSYWSTFIYDRQIAGETVEVYWRVMMYVCTAAVLYTLVGFNLYDRFNGWADSKFGEPKHTRAATKRKPKK